LKQFIALVGPTGAGKSTLLGTLKQTLPKHSCVFLSDSSGTGETTSPHLPFTAKVTELTKGGFHEKATPRSQLLLFWARLACVIEHDVAPNLRAGKNVFMDGFGGTILANTLFYARSETEREQLITLHKAMIEHCVLALEVPPPKYLWLRPSPEVAYHRLKEQGKLPRSNNPQEHIAQVNSGFDFYGTLPGQTVIRIDADLTSEAVLELALDHIDQKQFFKAAA
jgi:thymidylate kinase